MGVYHFAGLGRSIGAVTSAFSYLSALRKKGGLKAEQMFELSGESEEEHKTRGLAQALVLFATQEIIDESPDILCEDYCDNRAGESRGQEKQGRPVKKALLELLRKELPEAARPKKPFELYWCEYSRHDPVETFERVVQVLTAAKPPGEVGKEIWINLTGGSNIINGALQLAASLCGTPARMYYLLSDNPKYVRHAIHPELLGTDEDHFWVELPMVYLDFSPVHRFILEDLLTEPTGVLSLDQMWRRFECDPDLKQHVPDKNTLIHTYLRSLIAQRLISYETTGYRIGPGWKRMEKYLRLLPKPETPTLGSLAEIKAPWFKCESLIL